MAVKFETGKSISQKDIVVLKERLLTCPPNYIDFLALAIAKCSAVEFYSDPSKWNRIIADFKEEEQASGFHLFDNVYFDMRRPNRPYSSEVSGFLAVMRRSGNFRLWVTVGRGRYRMDAEIKAEIIKSEEQVFHPHKEYLERLTSKIDSQLGVHSS